VFVRTNWGLSLRLFLTLGIAALVCASMAQPQPQTAKGTRSEAAAKWLTDQLNRELSSRAGLKGPKPLENHPFHFVFLVDSSQASFKSAYPEFAKQTMRHFLRGIREAQEGRVGDTGGSVASIYPYQTELYTAAPYSAVQLTLDENAINDLASHVPAATLPTLADGTTPIDVRGGHDHTDSRNALLKLLRQQAGGGDPGQAARPPIVIQFTTVDVNETPGNQELDRRIRPLSARTSGLDDTGFIAYSVQGLPLKTESPGGGKEPFNVYVWTYGPPSFTGVASYAERTKPVPPPPQKTSIPTWPLWLVLIGAAGAGAYFLTKAGLAPAQVTITRNNSPAFSRSLRKGEAIEIWGPGATNVPVGAWILPAEVAPGVPPQKLASVRSVGRGVVIEPQTFDVMTTGQTGGGALNVDKGERKAFRLAKGPLGTPMFNLSVG
jgi:hypothetical protein